MVKHFFVDATKREFFFYVTNVTQKEKTTIKEKAMVEGTKPMSMIIRWIGWNGSMDRSPSCV